MQFWGFACLLSLLQWRKYTRNWGKDRRSPGSSQALHFGLLDAEILQPRKAETKVTLFGPFWIIFWINSPYLKRLLWLLVRHKPQTGGFIPSLSWLYRLKDCYRAVAQNILKLGGVGMTSQGPDPTPRSEPVKQLGNSPMTAAGSLTRSPYC